MTSKVGRWKSSLEEKVVRAKCETPSLFQDQENLMHCQNSECHKRLSLWKLIFHAVGKKQGAFYRVRCKHCGNINTIEKGRMGRELDELIDYGKDEERND